MAGLAWCYALTMPSFRCWLKLEATRHLTYDCISPEMRLSAPKRWPPVSKMRLSDPKTRSPVSKMRLSVPRRWPPVSKMRLSISKRRGQGLKNETFTPKVSRMRLIQSKSCPRRSSSQVNPPPRGGNQTKDVTNLLTKVTSHAIMGVFQLQKSRFAADGGDVQLE